MRLDEDGLVFNPSLELGPDYGFLMLIEGLINDIYTAAKLIPRLAKNRMSYKVSPGLTRPPPFLPCRGSYGSPVPVASPTRPRPTKMARVCSYPAGW